MIEVLIIDTGEKLDVKGGIKYTFQTSEIGDISEINSSWSWTIQFPKTPNNLNIFDGLGLVGSSSEIPYRSIKVAITYNSISIIEQANLSIVGFKDNQYQGHISSGIVDFFNKIKNLKLEDIPSIINSELSHDKNLTTIANSWSGNEIYQYIIADYNGKLNTDPTFVDFDSNYLVPSANVKWLMDKIFEEVGWTYDGLPEIELDWMTYGSYLQEEGESGLTVGKGITFNSIGPINYIPISGVSPQSKNIVIDTSTVVDGTYIINNGTDIEIVLGGNYRFTMPQINFSKMPTVERYGYSFKKNGNPLFPKDINGFYDLGNLTAGDKISFQITYTPYGGIQKSEISFNKTMSFIASDATKVNFQGASLEYNITDFFKEIMMRNASISIPDVKNKHISFYNIEDRLDFDVVDWTDKYIKTTDERYVYQDYARSNYLRHTYAEKEEDYHDGHFDIDNENLEESKTNYQSKTFSSNKNVSILNSNGETIYINGYQTYEIEQKNNEQIYKPLNKRFFFMRSITLLANIKIKINGTIKDDYPLAEARDFDRIIKDEYAPITNILNRVQLVDIELNLNMFDVKELSFDRKYYFRQEAAEFLLNKLTWDSESNKTKAEFIKVK